MLCLVRQGSSVVLEVQVDARAKGQECLDKVCQMLGIIEVDYFGLQYSGSHGDTLWLNMRNQIQRQLPGPSPYRLCLRVKFFVPPHLLLQETTRHQVYLSVKQDILENRLHVEPALAVRLAGLMAQVELGDLATTSGATALICYPKYLPQSGTRGRQSLRTPFSCLARRRAMAEHSLRWQEGSEDEGPLSLENLTDKTLPKLCRAVMLAHRQFAGTKPSAAEYLLLKEVAALENFGVEYSLVRDTEGHVVLFGVGPRGVTIQDQNFVLKLSIPYAGIHMATHAGRCFFLTHMDQNGESHTLGFKLESCQAANAIYRALTEKHAFYSCETVRNAVTSQFIRDLKGTIVSLFNENTALGKNYVFDIRRTCREVYDHTRRALYQMEMAVSDTLATSRDDDLPCDDQDCNGLDLCCQKSSCQDLRTRLASLQDSMLCRVCMDADMNTAFFPCRHVVCCSTCASLCEKCPLCRSSVEDVQHVYLPVAAGHHKDG